MAHDRLRLFSRWLIYCCESVFELSGLISFYLRVFYQCEGCDDLGVVLLNTSSVSCLVGMSIEYTVSCYNWLLS